MLDSALSQVPSSDLVVMRTVPSQDCPHPGAMSAQPWQDCWSQVRSGGAPANVAPECIADSCADAFCFCLFHKIEISCFFHLTYCEHFALFQKLLVLLVVFQSVPFMNVLDIKLGRNPGDRSL